MQVFSGDPVYLRPLEEAHLEAALDWFQNSPIAMTNLRWVLPLNTEESERTWLRQMRESDAHYVFAIHESVSGLHAGNIGLHEIDPKERSAELGVFLFDEFQGQGLAAWAIRKLLLWAFAIRNLHRVGLEVWSFNEPAKAVYRGTGFVQEGVRREGLWLDDRYWDVELWGILRREWQERFPDDRLLSRPPDNTE